MARLYSASDLKPIQLMYSILEHRSTANSRAVVTARWNTSTLAHVPSDCMIKPVAVSESTFSSLFSTSVSRQRETVAARARRGSSRAENVARELSSCLSLIVSSRFIPFP